MREVKAVIYGVGAMNSIATRLLLDKGVTIVGAISRSPEKVGRDLGEVTGLGRTLGVPIEGDADEVLGGRSADIAVVAVNSYMDDQYEHLRRCADHGVNAVTLAEECLYPWCTSPTLTAKLDRAAKRTGVTLTGTGHQDAYWVNMVSLLMGTAHHIESVHGQASWNVEDYGPEVARDQRVGDTPEEFAAWLAEVDLPPTFGRNVLDAILADAGLTASSFETATRPEIAERELRSSALDQTVPRGRVIGFTNIDTVHTVEGPVFSFEMTGRLYAEGEADVNEWKLEGEPELHLSNPRVPTGMTTCTQLVNRIPDVINAEPGFVTVEKLPKLRYRAFSLGHYVVT